MKLSQLAAKPTLTKITIDDAQTIKKYGEPVDFWIYDRYDMDLYMKLSGIDNVEDTASMKKIAYDIMLDEDGQKIMKEGIELPVDIQIKAVQKTLISLGNTLTQTSAK